MEGIKDLQINRLYRLITLIIQIKKCASISRLCVWHTENDIEISHLFINQFF